MLSRAELRIMAQDVFREVFGNASIELFDSMVARDVDNWDSLNHITLVMSLEECFCVKFSTREVMGWKNVGEMIDSLFERIEKEK